MGFVLFCFVVWQFFFIKKKVLLLFFHKFFVSAFVLQSVFFERVFVFSASFFWWRQGVLHVCDCFLQVFIFSQGCYIFFCRRLFVQWVLCGVCRGFVFFVVLSCFFCVFSFAGVFFLQWSFVFFFVGSFSFFFCIFFALVSVFLCKWFFVFFFAKSFVCLLAFGFVLFLFTLGFVLFFFKSCFSGVVFCFSILFPQFFPIFFQRVFC